MCVIFRGCLLTFRTEPPVTFHRRFPFALLIPIEEKS